VTLTQVFILLAALWIPVLNAAVGLLVSERNM
jgi:hypothetical protein